MSPARPPRRVSIVGNAPIRAEQGARIDAADWVLRFNNAAGLGQRAGRRVTHLALVNHGGQMREWLQDPGFLHRPAVRQARTFLFPFQPKPPMHGPQDEDGRDWTREAQVALAPLGAAVSILPEAVHREAEAILTTPARPKPVPSTGFLVALHMARTAAPEAGIDVHGFGFAGWNGHAWDRERRWFEAMAKMGRLRLHALDAPLAG